MGGERRETNDSDHRKLVQALNMVIGIAMGERLDSIRHGAKELDSRMSNRIGSLKKETTGSLDSLRAALEEMESKTAESVAGVKKQVTESTDFTRREMETKMADSIAAAERETTESMDKLQHSVLTRTAEMIGRLSKVEESQQKMLDDLQSQAPSELEKQMQIRVLAVRTDLETEVSGLRRELAGLRDELRQQMQATERVSAVLNSMASVFSVSPTQPQEPDPACFADGPKLTRDEVDNAVERALGEEWSPAKTVEMPNSVFDKKGE